MSNDSHDSQNLRYIYVLYIHIIVKFLTRLILTIVHLSRANKVNTCHIIVKHNNSTMHPTFETSDHVRCSMKKRNRNF